MKNNTTSMGGVFEQKRGVPFQATVVSVIIRDFIHLTERLPSSSLINLMTVYYEKVSIQVTQQQGILTSISNHSMVATFSNVEGGEPHARRALRCALAIAMIAYQTRFWIQQKFLDQGLDKFGVGIGIHSGELVFAEFGSAPHVQRVASGHAVSIASLIAVKSKELNWNVVCSEQALEIAGPGVRAHQRSLIGADWLKQPVRVAEVVMVRDNEVEVAPSGNDQMDATQVLERGAHSGRQMASDPASHATAESANLADFPQIPGYRCLRLLGQGGMSRVFLAERIRDGVHLALKLADGSVSEDSDMLYRFVDEYGLLEQIHHPNVLQIYDQGVTDDALFIVMEFLPGGTLRQYIGSKGMEPKRAWRVLREMVQALVEVHSMGVIHCDIKPENIMLRIDGTAVLGDFGIARRMIKARKCDDIVGTPYFMSPEQVRGEVEDEYTDIYSMGGVFFNMLSGDKPYLGETLEEIMQQHQHAPVPKLPQRYCHLQPFLELMMAKDKKKRFSAASMLEFMDELQEMP